MIAECYDLTVQCDAPRHVLPRGASWQGRSHTDTWRQAKADGWRLFKDGRAYCPSCKAPRKKPAATNAE